MATTAVNFRLDEQVKRNMDEVCKQLGITASAAFSMFASKVAREKRIPFEVSLDPFYSESNVSHILRGIEQIEQGRGIERELIDA